MQRKELKPTPLQETLTACKLMFKYALFLGIIVNLLNLATPLYSMQVLDRVIGSGNKNTLVMLTLIILSAVALLSLITAARQFSMVMMSNWIDKKLSESVIATSVRITTANSGSVGAQLVRDLETVKGFLTGPHVLLIVDIPWSIMFLVVLYMLHFYIGLLVTVGVVILSLIAVLTYRLTKPLNETMNETMIAKQRQTEQFTRNSEIISVMGLMPNLMKSYGQVNKKHLESQSLARKREAILQNITTFFRTFITMSVTGVGAILVISGDITAGTIIASSSIAGRALMPINQILQIFKSFTHFRKSFQRLSKAFEEYKPDEKVMSLPEPEGKIEVQGVYFAPRGAKKHTIKNISFTLEAGESMAIIGHSACGKTTLAKLMCGLWTPQVGAIRIDGASLADWNKDELGQFIGYVPQDVELFNGTVKSNIARLEEEPDSERVIQAAQLAGVHDLILKLPQGYETDLGFDGSSISGGQRQRIALARAFYGNPKILLLDEPNASLDKQGEEALETALQIAKEQKITSIIITHKNSILNIVDNILVMQNGMVVEYGKRDEVFKKLNMVNMRQPAKMA